MNRPISNEWEEILRLPGAEKFSDEQNTALRSAFFAGATFIASRFMNCESEEAVGELLDSLLAEISAESHTILQRMSPDGACVAGGGGLH